MNSLEIGYDEGVGGSFQLGRVSYFGVFELLSLTPRLLSLKLSVQFLILLLLSSQRLNFESVTYALTVYLDVYNWLGIEQKKRPFVLKLINQLILKMKICKNYKCLTANVF